MPELTRGLIIAGIALVIVIIALSAFVNVMFKLALNKRGDGSPALRYLQAEDFVGLVGEPIKFNGNKKQVLRGYLYSNQQFKTFKELVIFTHGIGAGHTAYTTEINRLAKEGFLVLAFDYTGCALSSERAMKSLIQPLVDLDYAFSYIESRSDIKDLKRYIVGHSWGGYVAMSSVLLKKHRVDKVVSLSAFLSPSLVTIANRPALYPLYPFIYMHGFWRYGRYATYNGVKALRKVKIPMLLIHGREDRVIKTKNSIDRFAKVAKAKANIELLYIEDRGHLPYLSKRAEDYLYQVQKDKAIYDRKNPVLNYEINYELITEEDEGVMKKIVIFLKK